jgi:hypothetical protein
MANLGVCPALGKKIKFSSFTGIAIFIKNLLIKIEIVLTFTSNTYAKKEKYSNLK